MSSNKVAMNNSLLSSYREMVLEHLFVGELMRHAWLTDIKRVEILKPEVDDGGYDLVVEANNLIRHVQLKTTFLGSTVKEFKVHLGLAGKPSGCVIVLLFDPQTLNIGQFLWFGGLPGKKIPDLNGYRIGKHSKGNAKGTKKERPMTRVIPWREFVNVDGISSIVDKLFGVDSHSHKYDVDSSLPTGLLPKTQRGIYRKSSIRDYTDKHEANIAAYYLSKFGESNLKLGNQAETLNRIAGRFNIKLTTLRNARDSFDPHTGSHRKGWRNKAGEVKALSPQYAEIHEKYKEYSEAELRNVILEFMSQG